jgi:hypothetical protein
MRRWTNSGRRVILRQDEVEPAPVEARHGHYLDAAMTEAQERGVFADLPGQGKPLEFGNDLARQDPRWLAHHLLHNAGFAPPFAECGRRLEEAQEASRRAVARWRDAAAAERPALAAALEAAWDEENRLIRQWNTLVPSPQLQRYPLPRERRWARLRGEAAEGR